jgi:hypothetical protein
VKTTVAIPLHRSAPWLDVVVGNIERLRERAHVVISDPEEADETLALLRSRFAGTSVEFRGRRALAGGWAAHCNDLLLNASTPYLMWLPHDDEIDATWISEAEDVLDAHPEAMLAVGTVVPVGAGVDLPFDPDFARPEPRARVSAALSALVSGRASSLGLLFRSVFRREGAVGLPESEWADVPWAIGMLAQGAALPTASVYRKRWHAGSASAAWSSMFESPGLRSRHLVEAVSRVGGDAADLLGHAWEDEVAPLARHIRAVDAELRRLEAENVALRASVSWRITAPLRRLRAALPLGREARRPSTRD